MDASTHQEIKRLYFAARAKRGPERGRFLDEHCAGEMRAEVEGLLRQTETLGGFLEQPATAGDRKSVV